MMPTAPGAGFVVIHAQFRLAFFKAQLYRPAHATHPHQLHHVDLLSSIAEIELHAAGVGHIPPKDQPQARARHALPTLSNAHECKVANNRPFAAFFNRAAHPGRFRQPSQHLVDPVRSVGRCFQPLPARFASFARPGRDDQRWMAPPDQGRTWQSNWQYGCSRRFHPFLHQMQYSYSALSAEDTDFWLRCLKSGNRFHTSMNMHLK